jgi:HSP20 family protein
MINGTQACGTRNGRNALTPIGTLFERLIEGDFLAPTPRTATLPVAVWQDDQAIFVEVDAPGVTPDGVTVTVHNRELTLQLERKGEKRTDGIDNRMYGTFEQKLKLPMAVDDAKVEAKLVNGVLHVVLPKSEQAKPRKVEVKGA